MPRLEAKDATYPTMKHNFKWAKILEIDYENDTCNIVIIDKDKVETSETYENVPIFYHCFPNVKKRNNGALEGASAAFARNDFVLVRFEDNEPVVVGRLDGLVPCLDVILWGDKAYGIPNLNEMWDKHVCSKVYCVDAEPFAYIFSNTFKFNNHFVTIVLAFTVKIQTVRPWAIGRDHNVKIIDRKLSLLMEKGIVHFFDGYWLDYENNYICIIKRIHEYELQSDLISLSRYSSDGTLVDESEPIIAKDYKLGNYNVTLNDYRLLCDKYGNIYAYCPQALVYYPKHYYKTTWEDFPEGWQEIEIEDGDYLKIFEQDIYQHDIIIDRNPKTICCPICVQNDCHVLAEEGCTVPVAWTAGLSCEYPILGNYYETENGHMIQVAYDTLIMCLDNHTAQFKNRYYGSICEGPCAEPEQKIVEGSTWTLGWQDCIDMPKGIWLYYGEGDYTDCSPPIIKETRRSGKKPADGQFLIKIPYFDNNIFAITDYAYYYDTYDVDFFILVKTPEYEMDKEVDLNNPYEWFEEVQDKGIFVICHSELKDKNNDEWIFDSKFRYSSQIPAYLEYTLKKNGHIVDIELESNYLYWILTLYRLIKALQQ